MDDKKDKKKTLTISTGLTKKIDISNISKDGKKSFSIEKKAPYKAARNQNKNSLNTVWNDGEKHDPTAVV